MYKYTSRDEQNGVLTKLSFLENEQKQKANGLKLLELKIKANVSFSLLKVQIFQVEKDFFLMNKILKL